MILLAWICLAVSIATLIACLWIDTIIRQILDAHRRRSGDHTRPRVSRSAPSPNDPVARENCRRALECYFRTHRP